MKKKFKEMVTPEMGTQSRKEESSMIWATNVAGDILQRTFSAWLKSLLGNGELARFPTHRLHVLLYPIIKYWESLRVLY